MSEKTQVRTRAIVLRSNNFSEADRFCTLLSPQLGLIEVKARGARRSRSPLLLGTEFLSLAEFDLFYYKDRYTINSADLVYAFPAIRADIERLTCASHLSELLRDLVLPEEVSDELYELMARALSAMEKDSPGPLSVVHACELRLMRLGGFGLELNRCVHCQKEMDLKEAACFDFTKMGITCAAHQPQAAAHRPQADAKASPYRPAFERLYMDLSAASLAAIDWFSHCPLDRLFSFESSAGIEKELNLFSKHYLAWNLDKQYNKLDLLLRLDQLGSELEKR